MGALGRNKINIMSNLDEKGFVFIGNGDKPYWCRIWCEEPIILYWNEGQNSWVVFGKTNDSEIEQLSKRKISDEQAEIYHKLHNQSQ